MRRAVGSVLAIAVVALGVVLLRAELMTVEVEQPEGSFTDVVVAASTRESPEVLQEMTHGLLSACRLLVNAEVVEDSFVPLDDGVFSFRLRPGLDEFDRRELRGCLSDLRVQHLLVEVRRLETITPAGEDGERSDRP